MDKAYEVRYKGRIEHAKLDEHSLVERVRSGQVSGVHSYRSAGADRWLPVFRMEYQRNSEGRWTIIDEAQPAKPPEPETPVPQPPPQQPAQISNPSVVIMNGAAVQQPAADPAAGRSGIAAAPGGGLSIAGFIVSLVAAVLAVGLLTPQLFRIEVGIAGAVLAAVSIVFSACGMPSRRHRGLAIAGLVIGIVTILAWGAFIAYLVLRFRGK